MVTLQASGQAVRGATYRWNFGNGSTATGFGPFNVVYPAPKPYAVTLTVSRFGCQAAASLPVTPDLGSRCCPTGIAAANLLGTVAVPLP